MAQRTVKRATKKKSATARAVRSGNGSKRPAFKRVTKRQIQWVVARLVEALDPEKIILFGSYAYGKPNRDSDVDMLVIMDSAERWPGRITQAYRAVEGKTFPMDILVHTPAELAHRVKINDWFMQEIVERGKVLYERGVAEPVAD